jgi:archaellum component FlaC
MNRMDEIEKLLDRYYGSEDGFEQTDIAIDLIQDHMGWLMAKVKKLENQLEKLDMEYDKLYEQAKVWRFESGNW